MNSGTDRKSSRKSTREFWFGLITIAGSVLLCLLLAEYGLRWYQQSINNSSKGDPGLLHYHPRLGWTLTPSWQGRHQHHDFDVQYTINEHSYRGIFPENFSRKNKRRVAIIGDSFSFGLGANDDDIFTAQLNQRQSEIEFLNFSVPGYSTDQQFLLIKSSLQQFNADDFILMFYLGNDLLDIMLPYPLQVEQAKPLFIIGEDNQLVLENVPVPRQPKPAALRSSTISSIIFGDSLKDYQPTSFLNNSQLWQRLMPAKAAADKAMVFSILDQRLHEHEKLMRVLLGEMHDEINKQNGRFRIALLPGSSFVLLPDSYSAYFQDYVRLFILDIGEQLNIPVIDVAGQMRALNALESSAWYYPNEGHLTRAGHKMVSDILADALSSN